MSDLNLTVIDAWRPWLDSTGQTGGFVTVYDKLLTFATVRQAGHMAPYTQVPWIIVKMSIDITGIIVKMT